MFLHIQCVWTSCILMIELYLHVVCLLSTHSCDSTLVTDFDIAFELDNSRSSSRHLCTPPYRSGSTELLKFRVFLNALPQSQNSWFLGKLWLKWTGVVTNSFCRLFILNLFSIDRIPRGFVHIEYVGREIRSTSHPCDYVLSTGSET